MKKKIVSLVCLIFILTALALIGCASEDKPVQEVAVVSRGDIMDTVTADGQLDMPHEAKLRFGTPGTVKKIYVEEGDEVKEGTLLVKLDDTSQKLAMASAQYDVELAMNEIVEKIHPALMGYPKFYPDDRAILSVVEAQKELGSAQELLGQGEYQKAMSELRLAMHDMESALNILDDPTVKPYLEHLDAYGNPVQDYPQILQAIDILETEIDGLAVVQTLIEEGNYEGARTALQQARDRLQEVYQLVDNVSGRLQISQRIGACCPNLTTQGSRAGITGLQPISYPDTSTALSWLRQVEDDLQEINMLMEAGGNQEELAEKLRMAQHDIDLSLTILADNELIYRSGMNLKTSRQVSLNLQKAELALRNAKEDLMKTEILAPFDGTVVSVGVKEDDQLSAFDYSAVTAVHLVDTETVKLDGMVDEVDIGTLMQDYKEKQKENKKQEAVITVDAFPDVELGGYVTFISPFGTDMAGIVEFPVTITLNPTDVQLLGTLTATAEIIIGERHENVLLVPSRAVKSSDSDFWVDVVVDEKTGATAKRSIVVGLQNRNYYEVISGLEEGEKVQLTSARR